MSEESENGITEEERGAADVLNGSRPVPAADFRGALGRYLERVDPGYGHRPARLRLTVAAYGVAAVVLMGLGLLQATGSF